MYLMNIMSDDDINSTSNELSTSNDNVKNIMTSDTITDNDDKNDKKENDTTLKEQSNISPKEESLGDEERDDNDGMTKSNETDNHDENPMTESNECDIENKEITEKNDKPSKEEDAKQEQVNYGLIQQDEEKNINEEKEHDAMVEELKEALKKKMHTESNDCDIENKEITEKNDKPSKEDDTEQVNYVLIQDEEKKINEEKEHDAMVEELKETLKKKMHLKSTTGSTVSMSMQSPESLCLSPSPLLSITDGIHHSP